MESGYGKHWMHRGQGLIGLALGGFFAKAGLDVDSTLLLVGGSYLMIDGAGDLITGYHHYCGQRAIEGIKYVHNRLA